MREVRVKYSVLFVSLLAACAGATDETSSAELQAYFEGKDQHPDLVGLNGEFSRNAVRASGYARSGASLPDRESWSAVARVGAASLEPVDIGVWLEAGEIDESGEFAPCLRTRCSDMQLTPNEASALGPWLENEDVAERAERVRGAALQLVTTEHAVVWSEAHGRGLTIQSQERTIAINPKLVLLVGSPTSSPVEPPLPNAGSASSAAGSQVPRGEVRSARDELKNHEPPPEVAEQDDSSGCDCGDLFDFKCEEKKASSGTQDRSGQSAWLAAVVGLCMARRSGRRNRGLVAWVRWRKLLPLLLIPGALLSLSARAFAQDAAVSSPSPAPAHVVVHGFAPDALIAIDGVVVGRGSFSGPVQPGPHLVQVYRPGGASYDFPITAQPGITTQVPPPSAPLTPPAAAAPEPPPPVAVKRTPRWEDGPYVLAQLGFVVPTARPDGFHYELGRDEDTGQDREKSGIGYMVGATGGYRLARWVGLGGLLMYGRAGGAGTVRQIERTSAGGRLEHEGPADFTAQSLRFGPHFRLMAGGNRARFLGGMSVGAVHTWIDLEHPDVVEQNGVLVQRGTFHHDYNGLGQFVGWDLGAEFNPGDHLLLGVAFDLFVDGTGNLPGDPFGGTALGYFGMSIRLGYHAWALR